MKSITTSLVRQCWPFLTLVLLTLCLVSAVHAADPAAADRAAIMQLEREWTQSFVTMDAAANERILADDFIGTEPSGKRVSKADILASMKTGEPMQSGHLNDKDVTIRFYGETAVVTGSSSWKRKSNGKTGRYIWTDVLVKRNAKWRVVASQDLEVVDKP
jgi:ketosteroid isomerase-like protein